MTDRSLETQIRTLVRLGYPDMFAVSEREFIDTLVELGASAVDSMVDDDAKAAFILVINSASAPAERMLPLAQRNGRVPIESLHPKRPQDFTTIPPIALPHGDAYLMVDVDRGCEYRNMTPDAAGVAIARAARSPLTIAEGIALLTHAPELLQPNHCFSLLASRCADRRVPALWLSAGRPKLGWCWAGNPHGWLGSASCGSRAGSVAFRPATLDAA